MRIHLKENKDVTPSFAPGSPIKHNRKLENISKIFWKDKF